MKLKKSIIFILLFVLTFLVVGCNNGDTKYTIKYFVDGVEDTSITPNEYIKGEETNLGSPILSKDQVFSGWYANKDLTGNEITKIEKTDTGNKEFYGSIITNKKSYNIIYYVDGKEVDLSFNSYKEGDITKLPIPTLSENQEFDGWYQTVNLQGETISTVEGLNKDLTLYGKIKDKTLNNELAQALSNTNYHFTFTTLVGDYIYSDEYYNDNGKYRIKSEFYEQYYGLVDNKKTYFVSDENNSFYYINEDHQDFIYYVEGLNFLDLTKLDPNWFVKENDIYTAKADNLQEVCRLLTNVDDSFDTLKITLKDNYIQTIEITASTIQDTETIENSYLLEFSLYNNVKVEFPTDAVDINKPNKSTKIGDIYSLEEGSLVLTEGKVTGVYGNNFYLNDGETGILVYMGKNSSFSSKIKVGNNIKVYATLGSYNDVYQLTDVTEIEIADKEYDVTPIEVDTLDLEELEYLIHELVNVNNLKITKLPTDFSNAFSDIVIECSNGVNTITIFISKHLDETSKNKTIEFIKTLKINDVINIKNGHIGYHKGTFQVCITDASVIEKGSNEVKLIDIEVLPETLTFDYTVTLDEILKQIIVKEVYSNNTKVELTKEEYTIDTSSFKLGVTGTYIFKVTYKTFTKNINIVLRDQSKQEIIRAGVNQNQYLTVKDQMGYDPSTQTTYGINVGLPSIGTPKVLVIPIEFTDCPAPATIKTDLQKAFFGNEVDTGWESLNSYYKKSSYGKLDIKGTVLDPYNTKTTVSEYDRLNKEYQKDLNDYYNDLTDVYPISPEGRMIKGALELNDKNINYNDYDTNSDGYIDAIYIIYVNDYNRVDDDSLWWAFTNEYATNDIELYDDVEADFYVFMSYKFLFDDFHGQDVKYNTETIIHESGHLMGLNDYYDYGGENDGPDGGLGGGDMMDNNLGDHNPYSKVMLGWIDPIIVTNQNITIDLPSFGKSGEAIFIFKNYNNSFFTEYFVIDFYTPDGLNAAGKGDSGLFSIPGIRIYHVDSTLNDKQNCFSVFDITKFNNGDTAHKQIALVEADGKNDILKNRYSTNEDLFQVGSTFNNPRWYDNSKSGFKLTVNSISETKANISITY